MADLYYNYPQMKKVSTEIDVIRGEFEKLTKLMDSIVATSDKGFTGDSQKAFREAHANVIERYKKMDIYLKDLSETIEKAKNQTQKSDADTASRVRESFKAFL